MTITLRFSTVDGVRKTKRFKTLAGARSAAHAWVGADADLGSAYAVSTDGVVKVTVEGASLNDIFGKIEEATPAAPAPEYVAIKVSDDSYDLHHGKVCPATKFATVFKVLDSATGCHDDGWAIKGKGGSYDCHFDTSVHYPTFAGALAEAKSASKAWEEYLNAEANAEAAAEGAWLRYAEMGTMESQHEEGMDRAREAAYG